MTPAVRIRHRADKTRSDFDASIRDRIIFVDIVVVVIVDIDAGSISTTILRSKVVRKKSVGIGCVCLGTLILYLSGHYDRRSGPFKFGTISYWHLAVLVRSRAP